MVIALGLVNTSLGTALWTIKNLRVGVDCHSATKSITMIDHKLLRGTPTMSIILRMDSVLAGIIGGPA
jgi:hypothetical protein